MPYARPQQVREQARRNNRSVRTQQNIDEQPNQLQEPARRGPGRPRRIAARQQQLIQPQEVPRRPPGRPRRNNVEINQVFNQLQQIEESVVPLLIEQALQIEPELMEDLEPQTDQNNILQNSQPSENIHNYDQANTNVGETRIQDTVNQNQQVIGVDMEVRNEQILPQNGQLEEVVVERTGNLLKCNLNVCFLAHYFTTTGQNSIKNANFFHFKIFNVNKDLK